MHRLRTSQWEVNNRNQDGHSCGKDGWNQEASGNNERENSMMLLTIQMVMMLIAWERGWGSAIVHLEREGRCFGFCPITATHMHSLLYSGYSMFLVHLQSCTFTHCSTLHIVLCAKHLTHSFCPITATHMHCAVHSLLYFIYTQCLLNQCNQHALFALVKW